MNVNIWDVTEPIQALIRSGERVDAATLADPGVPLGELRHNLSLRHEVHAHEQPEEIMAGNSFNARERLTVGELTYEVFRLDRVDGAARLPYSLKVLLENLLRNEDGRLVTGRAGRRAWPRGIPSGQSGTEIQFTPARVLMQDFTGVPVRGRPGRDA